MDDNEQNEDHLETDENSESDENIFGINTNSNRGFLSSGDGKQFLDWYRIAVIILLFL